MKASHKKYKYTNEELTEMLYDRMFKKYYSGNDKIFRGDFIIHANISYLKNRDRKQLIATLLRAGADVRTGYTCTSIRGAHRYIIAEGGFAD